MWWNFVARTHDEIVAFRAEWEDQILDPDGDGVDADPDDAGGLHEGGTGQRCAGRPLVRDGRFGRVVGDHRPPIPAPPMPQVRLRERR